MQDETVTTESLHGRMGSFGRPPAKCHSEFSTGVHAMQSLNLYV
jgi:hypothetical protein